MCSDSSIDEENIPPAVVDRDGVIQFNDCVTKKVYDIIKVFAVRAIENF